MDSTSAVGDLPSALDSAVLASRLSGRRPAVFLDYDGVLTPIVDRPEAAVLSDTMRSTVRALADRCPVCIVTGRDRAVVQRLMGIDDLTVAGSHGFDIWKPGQGVISPDSLATSPNSSPTPLPRCANDSPTPTGSLSNRRGPRWLCTTETPHRRHVDTHTTSSTRCSTSCPIDSR